MRTSIAVLVSKTHEAFPYVILLEEPEVIPLIVVDDQPEEVRDREAGNQNNGGME